MTDDPLYHERLTSNQTEAFFLTLMLLFFLLLFWRVLLPVIRVSHLRRRYDESQ